MYLPFFLRVGKCSFAYQEKRKGWVLLCDGIPFTPPTEYGPLLFRDTQSARRIVTNLYLHSLISQVELLRCSVILDVLDFSAIAAHTFTLHSFVTHEEEGLWYLCLFQGSSIVACESISDHEWLHAETRARILSRLGISCGVPLSTIRAMHDMAIEKKFVVV